MPGGRALYGILNGMLIGRECKHIATSSIKVCIGDSTRENGYVVIRSEGVRNRRFRSNVIWIKSAGEDKTSYSCRSNSSLDS
jgi:hypothetical protein